MVPGCWAWRGLLGQTPRKFGGYVSGPGVRNFQRLARQVGRLESRPMPGHAKTQGILLAMVSGGVPWRELPLQTTGNLASRYAMQTAWNFALHVG